jgi:hypothetical protein
MIYIPILQPYAGSSTERCLNVVYQLQDLLFYKNTFIALLASFILLLRRRLRRLQEHPIIRYIGFGTYGTVETTWSSISGLEL